MVYQTLTLTNLPVKSAVRISAAATEDASTSLVDKITIKRKVHGTSTWTTIKTIAVTNISHFSFNLLDYGTKSKHSYDYGLFPSKLSIEEDGIIGEVNCDFDSLFIGTATIQHVAILNVKCVSKRSSNSVVTTPLYSKYPRHIQIGSANYSTGSASGIFTPYENDCKPIFTHIRQYKDALLDFLCNGTPKILKTPDGRAWYVAIGPNPGEDDSDISDAAGISFEWTEIGELPIDWVVAA